jgi:catechol 2,3-dioxygenase-like lactoylglutathione lyase family enzyme
MQGDPSVRPIRRLQALALETPALDPSIDYYTQGFGLRLVQRTDDTATFAGADGRTVILTLHRGARPGLRALTLVLDSAHDLELAASRLRARGVTVVASDDSALTVRDPDGRHITFVADDYVETGPDAEARPLHVSHVVINSQDAARLTSFFVDTLGFTVADRYEQDLLTFLRCAQPQHHCIGISPGAQNSLNHFSVDCGSIDALMKGVGRMQNLGLTPIWGPGRHGPGGNVFCYFEDPTGFVSEFTCDVIQIHDDAAWVVREWPRVPDTANVWGTGGPSPRAIELMSGRLPGA